MPLFTAHQAVGVFVAALLCAQSPLAAERLSAEDGLFRRDNLIAWCIVPFDTKKRGPEERAEMLARLGFRHFAYDYRAEHVPTFAAEIAACKKHGVALDAWWFPKTLNDEARQILEVCRKHDVHPQLWVTGSGEPTASRDEQGRRVEQESARIRPIAEAAAAQGMKVGLYNHGGWFGEPENQIAIIAQLKLPNVGLVYNLHHGHDQLPRLAELLPKMLPHLLAVNLNGMVPEGDKHGQKILPLGQGSLDLELLRAIRASGYRGPIGIIGHTQDDAEARLQDNLDGLDWLVPQLDGRPPGPQPQPRTPVAAAKVSSAVPVLKSPPGRAPPPSPGPHLKPVDDRLQAVLIDRSPADVYLGIKADDAGNLFVGGRAAVFLFAARDDGSFAPRHELLRFPVDSIIVGLEFRGDDLYVLTANALYLVPQGRVQRTDLAPQRILWGLPLDLHVSFHCLAWGPDGDLYLTHGDPLLQYGDWDRADHWGHWKLYCGREGRPLPYTGQGAVLRMKPDGSDVRVVARGLRGPVGLAFDRAGNLFTNDNDHESRADRYAPSRLLHVVDGIDFGWPRGWAASKSPDRYDLIEPMCELGRGVPCDLTFYDRPLLADLVGERLLMCRWDSHSITAYRPQPHGITFQADEETVVLGNDNCRPVGIAADRAGRLFATALYMSSNMAAPDCVSDLVMFVRSKPHSILPDSRSAPVEALNGAAETPAWDDARSNDTYRRQLGTTILARESSAAELCEHAVGQDEPTRIGAILAIGRKLTVPSSDYVPPAALALFYPKGSSFFHRKQSFYGRPDEIDLADLGRVGSFTIAQWWATTVHTSEQETLYTTLTTALNDSSDRVRLQAAYYLSLLHDPRSDPLVERTQSDVQLRRLQAATEHRIEKVWIVGPFDDGTEMASAARPDRGPLDLTASYDGRTWQARSMSELAEQPSAAAGSRWNFLHFRVQSARRQHALMTSRQAGVAQVWQNETSVPELSDDKVTRGRSWIVDLQPGGNDFLIRVHAASTVDLRIKAHAQLELMLPEKLDSSLLTERLRSASAAGSTQSVAADFAATDWSQAARQGDAVAGRKLFGSLGCAKCHAVVPDQKSAGGPSLFEAKRRFTIPHLVESVLLPSRQVAEPFRAQTFMTDDGRTLSGLVTNETADVVELLLPDATRPRLAKLHIEERAGTTLSPMPQGLVKTPDELRHLLTYLLSDRPLPP